MKKRLRKNLVTMSTYLSCTLLALVLSMGGLLAFESKAQKLKSVRDVMVDLQFDNAPLLDAFRQIEQKTSFTFMYDINDIDRTVRINFTVKHTSLYDVLVRLSGKAHLQFKQVNFDIDVKKITGHIKTPVEVMLETFTVSGKVTSSGDGEPLPGVNVMIKNSSQGTVTDANGMYNLDVPSEESILVFSSIGFLTEEVAVGTRRVIDLSMSQDVTQLNEVVVVGYGSVKKSNLTGAVSSVKGDEILSSPIQSVDQGLVGRAAGVMVTQTSGAPGSAASIRIRGTSSLQGGNEPLYVIDGFPVYSEGFGNTAGKEKISGLATLNPNDIESIEILKDASATAIYGARASNGVVLITTKSGKDGHDRISFDSYYGVQQPTRKMDVMNAYDYALLVNEAYENDGALPVYDAAKMAELQANPKGTDWQDEIFRAAPIRSYQLSFSGGNNKSRYAISAAYFDQDGIIINSNFKRYSSRINVDRTIWDNLKVGTHISLTRIVNKAVPTSTGGPSGGVVSGAMKFNPVLGIYSDDEQTQYTQVNVPGILMANPVATAKERNLETISSRLLGDLYLEWEVTPGIKLRSSIGTNVAITKNNSFTPSTVYEGSGIASASVGAGFDTGWLNENTISYTKNVDGLHAINAVAGVTFQGNRYEGLRASSSQFVNDLLEENSLESGAIYNQPQSDVTQWGLISYLARVNYGFRDKYLLSLNGRVDGSSRFGVNNRYAFFPSVALAWRAIEEPFLSGADVFSDLKIRTSFGYSGNQEIGLYNSLPTLSTTTYTIGNTLLTGFIPNKIPNPDLKWEKSAQLDVGIDFGFFDNRLRITTDYYYRKTTNLIYNVLIPMVSGFSTSIRNIGSMQNHGLELEIESDNVRTANFRWTTNFNISFNRNKVLELGGEEFKDIGDGDGHLKTNAIHRLYLNQPIGIFYGYVADGLFASADEVAAGPNGPTNYPGGRRYKDLGGPDGNPDGKVNADYDRRIIGNPNPDFFGGMYNTFQYKGFEASIFTQWSVGNDMFNYNSLEMYLPSGGQNVFNALKDRWTPENTDAVYPVATRNRNNLFSDFFIEDGSYLKIKTITLSYTFSGLWLKHLADLKVYATAQNFFTFTNYSGYDPEVSYRGSEDVEGSNLEMGEDFGTYPQSKTILVGIKINLD